MRNLAAQLIKFAAITLCGRDDGPFPVSQVTYNNKTGQCHLVSPYGLYSNPPRDSLVLMMNVMGQEENRSGIASYPTQRFQNLKEGEVTIGNPTTQGNVKFDQEGNTQMFSPNGTQIIVTSDLSIVVGGGIAIAVTGNATITGSGNLTVDGPSVHLGQGGPLIARVGDHVVCPAGTGVITTGSSKHTAT